MKALFLTASFPDPPTSGGALRAHGMLSGLAADGHEITLLCFHEGDLPADAPLREACAHVETVPPPDERTRRQRLRDVLLGRADIARRLYSGALRLKLAALTRRDFDFIQFEGIESAAYLPYARQIVGATPLIFDTFNAEAELQRVIYHIDRRTPRTWPRALYSWLQARRIRRFEGELCRLADAVIAVSPEDAAILQAYTPERPVHLLPSGIHTERYQTPSESVDLGPQALVFTGKMDYRPNVDAVRWFAEAVLPAVLKRHPEARFIIVGQRPAPAVQALAEHPQITVTGWVASVAPYLHAAAVYVAPLRMGSGTRLKLLEAMATGCGIVATDLAASGLLPEVRQTLTLADDAPAFVDAISQHLSQPDAGRGERARQAVRQHYDWGALLPRLKQIYGELGLA